MLLVAGAFELVPLLVVLLVAVVVSLPAAASVGLLAALLHNPLLACAAGSLAALGLGYVAERAVRARSVRSEPEWVATLAELGLCPAARVEAVGGKAKTLGRLAALGAPVPEGIVLTTALVERIAAATAGGKTEDRIWSVLPASARRDIEAFLAGSKGRVVVRASFTDHGAKHSYAGVFPAVRDVNPRDRDAIVAAVRSLLAASDDAVAREYRRRRNAPPGPSKAVVIERQVDAEILGSVRSRGPLGRADSVVVDFARRRSPTRSYEYDLVNGEARLLGAAEQFDTPAWMHRLAVLAVTLELELGAPVLFEFAIEGGQPYLIDARKVALPEQKTWVHAAPLDGSGERRATFAHEVQGGLSLVRSVLEHMLERASAPATVKEEEVRYADGLVYVDAEVIRRALGRLGADVLLRGGLRATLRSIARVRKSPLPRVPTVTEITPSAWRELRSWHDRHLVLAARVRLELVAREWLIHTLLRLLDGSGAVAEDRRGHPALRWLLARRAREAKDEAARQLDVLEKAETELSSAVARLLVRGAAAWNAMFKGDRHLYATLAEIDRWHDDVAGRDALEAEWRARGTAFEQRKAAPTLLRVHRPALPAEAPPGARGGTVSGLSVAPGSAAGPLVLSSGLDQGQGSGAVLLVLEPRPELCTHLYDARGVVLLAGGIVSNVAILAAELGIPVVLCPAARSLATRDVSIDGAAGTITVIS